MSWISCFEMGIVHCIIESDALPVVQNIMHIEDLWYIIGTATNSALLWKDFYDDCHDVIFKAVN